MAIYGRKISRALSTKKIKKQNGRVESDDFCDALIGAILTSFVDDYFKYLRAYNKHHEEKDLYMMKSVLYQFEHCPWLVYVEGMKPKELVDALVKRGEELYGKEENTN